MVKITLKAGKASSPPPPTPASATGLKLNLQPKKPISKKRAADDVTALPDPKRRLTLKIGESRKPSAAPKLKALNATKKPPPPRLPGLGYDSEDSEAEEDPAIQQAFVLRMRPGEDCDYIHDAITNGKVGLPVSEGGAEVSFRFIEKDLRRAIVTVRGRMYAAVLVDLPCIVETMKSWDKKGWWKVADMCQMLLVLGTCRNEDEARTYALPKEVEKDTFQYPHGLTPPMHWVRKRRFRKRLSYKTIANVDEEVERLLREDEQAEKTGGSARYTMIDPTRPNGEQAIGESEIDEYESQDALDTFENGQQPEDEEFDDEEFAAELEGGLQAAFDEEETQAAFTSEPLAGNLIDSPAQIPDQAPAFTAPTTSAPIPESESVAATPAQATSEADAEGDDESSSDEDDEEDEEEDEADSPMDEDALARAAERNQQLEELADLEREIASQKRKCDGLTNQLLKQRAVAQLRNLQEDRRVKRGILGLDEEDEGAAEGGTGEG